MDLFQVYTIKAACGAKSSCIIQGNLGLSLSKLAHSFSCLSITSPDHYVFKESTCGTKRVSVTYFVIRHVLVSEQVYISSDVFVDQN